MNTKIIGDIGEKIARDVYEEKGYKILETNAKYCDCEVDLICECYVDENGNLIRQNDKNRISKFLEKLGIKRKSDKQNKGERTIVFARSRRDTERIWARQKRRLLRTKSEDTSPPQKRIYLGTDLQT